MDKKQKVNVDEVLDKFDMFGRYHFQCMIILMFGFAANAMIAVSYIFVNEETGYRCKDKAFSNSTCKSMDGKQCTDWIYDNPDSFVAEFELACQDWKRTLVGTIQNFGCLIGHLIAGPLSDKQGRKKAIIITGFIGAVIGFLKSFSHSYWMFIALEFLGATLGNSYSPLCMLTIEIVSANKRVIFQNVCAMAYTLGGISFATAAWAFPYWRNLLRIINTPGLLFIAFCLLLDESPRWLLTKGKKTQAIDVLEKMSSKCKVMFDKEVLDDLTTANKDKNISFVHVLKITLQSATLLRRVMVLTVLWASSTFVYYGTSITAVSLQGDKYVNYGLLEIADVPGYFTIMYILNKYNRKYPLIYSLIIAAVILFAHPFLPKSVPWLSVMIYIISKILCSFSANITYIFTSELFPTYTRNSMYAICSAVGRVGGMLSPQTPLLKSYWCGLPSMVFGGTSLLAGLTTFLVPDTANSALPDNVLEAEAIGLLSNSCKCRVECDNLEGRTKCSCASLRREDAK